MIGSLMGSLHPTTPQALNTGDSKPQAQPTNPEPQNPPTPRARNPKPSPPPPTPSRLRIRQAAAAALGAVASGGALSLGFGKFVEFGGVWGFFLVLGGLGVRVGDLGAWGFGV